LNISKSPTGVITYADARDKLKQIIDQGLADCGVAITSREDVEDAAVMSLDTNNSTARALHLLKVPANVKYLEISIAQIRKGQTKT